MESLELRGFGLPAFELVVALWFARLLWTASGCSEEEGEGEVVDWRIRSLGLRILIGRFAIMVDLGRSAPVLDGVVF